MMHLPRLLAPALLAAALGGCAIIPNAAPPRTTALAPGSAVALGQSVRVGSVIATPLAVVEDSRCPINARCVWAGRLVVKTRIDGDTWGEAAQLALGEPYTTHGTTLALVSGEPGRVAGEGKETPKDAYRFTYEAR
ncbi:MAG: hypothetical protein ACKO01_08035 [Erythrobacter sp.]